MTALPDDVRALLQAVLDALDIPRPAFTDQDIAAHGRLFTSRAADIRIQLESLLRAPAVNPPAETARHLRAWIADSPVDYTPRQNKDGAQ